MNPFSLDGAVALVTGGSRGIGLGAARALCESGASVILVARHEDELVAASKGLTNGKSEVWICPCDLQNTGNIANWFADCVTRFGQPNILVNAAGMNRRSAATELNLSDWNDTFALNVTAMFELSRCFARGLIGLQRKGKIVNVASIMTAAARRGIAAYTASKGAVGQLTKALAIEWAMNGIHVNAVAPGYIDTELNRDLILDTQFNEWVKKRCPLGRWGTPEDISWPIVFLASPASDFMTGQVIYVDGGWLATF